MAKAKLLSPCHAAPVVVPVDVTAHLYVLSDGTISNRLADTLADLKWQATNSGGAEIREAYCIECGGPVRAPGVEGNLAF